MNIFISQKNFRPYGRVTFCHQQQKVTKKCRPALSRPSGHCVTPKSRRACNSLRSNRQALSSSICCVTHSQQKGELGANLKILCSLNFRKQQADRDVGVTKRRTEHARWVRIQKIEFSPQMIAHPTLNSITRFSEKRIFRPFLGASKKGFAHSACNKGTHQRFASQIHRISKIAGQIRFDSLFALSICWEIVHE